MARAKSVATSEKTSPVSRGRVITKLDAPSNLRGESLDQWKRVTTALANEGKLREWMRAPLMRYCIMWARYIEATNAVAKHGMFTKNKQTKIESISCYARAETDAHARLSRLEKQLGLTPESGEVDDDRDAGDLEIE